VLQRIIMFSTIEELLFAQAAVTGAVLTIFGIAMARRGLFGWTTAGFWAWAAFALYFVINPLASIYWNLGRYAIRLSMSGGLERGEWILLCSVVGIVVFFIAYLNTKTRPYTWNLRPDDRRITLSMALVIVTITGLSTLLLLTFRTGYLSTSRQMAIEGGEFTGEITGYEYMGHVFAFLPIILLLLSPRRSLRWLGGMLGGAYVVLSLPAGWARFSLISMLIAMTLSTIVRRQRSWPRPIMIGAILLLGAVLEIRGHAGLETSDQFLEIVSDIPNEIGSVLAAGDTGMLASWYLQSYIKDTITGYDYGIPFLNYALFGAIPGRFFPQKYFLVDWLRDNQPTILDPLVLTLLYGSKASMFGSFYRNGGLVAVIIGALLTGIISRKIDGMLLPDSTMLVRATGIAWLSMLWIIWGSSETWALIRFGTMIMPALVIWFVAPKQPTKSKSPVPSYSPKLPTHVPPARYYPHVKR
jgi:hypothetical protein